MRSITAFTEIAFFLQNLVVPLHQNVKSTTPVIKRINRTMTSTGPNYHVIFRAIHLGNTRHQETQTTLNWTTVSILITVEVDIPLA